MITREQQAEMLKLVAATMPEKEAASFLETGRKTFIHEDLRKEHDLNDELAILRKAVAYLFELISTLHEGEIHNEEFSMYHELVEHIKKDATDKLSD